MFRYIIFLLIITCGVQLTHAQPSANNSPDKQQAAHQQESIKTAVNSAIGELRHTLNAEEKAYREKRDSIDDAFKGEQSKQNEVIKDSTDRMAIYTGISVFFTIVLAIVAIFQWRQTRKIYESTYRPVIGLENITVENVKGRGKKTVCVEVRNVGQSLARNYQTESFTNFFDKATMDQARLNATSPEPYRDEPDDQTRTKMVIHPHSSRYTRIDLTPDEWKRVKARTHTLCSWTRVTYESITGGKYFVESYFKYNVLTNKMEGCATHNDAN